MKEIILNNIYTIIEQQVFDNKNLSLPDKLGIAVLYANKYKSSGLTKHYSILEYIIGDIIQTTDYTYSDIVKGSSGVLWLIKYLIKLDIIDITPKLINSIETITISNFNKSLSLNNWDYYNGAIGHLTGIQINHEYSKLLEYLHNSIVAFEDTYELRSQYYNSSTNLGLHAGILGILVITNRLIKNNTNIEKAAEIQKKILNIIFTKLESLEYNHFPALYENNSKCRMCWAYGDLILSIILLAISKTNNDKDLELKSFKIAYSTVKKKNLDETMIYDSCLISGASGNYLLYDLLHQYTHILEFHEAKEVWLNHTYEILKKNNYHNMNRYTGVNLLNFSIFDGLGGIGMALEEYDNNYLEYILLDLF